jgi:formylglycine-generating enzyme required for sulfatase activity
VSADGGATFAGAAGATGAVGAGVAPGTGKTVTWDAGAAWPAQLLSNVKARVTADDSNIGPAPAGFALIPAGTFTMGDSLDGEADAPTHSVTLSAFYMAKTLTTWADWVAVRAWAVTHGYTDLTDVGAGKADTHPVQSVSWYEMVKWCNARSEMEGLTPVYYTDTAQTTVYRTGNVDMTNTQVKWTASGYRLPTEAEWEYAARGGLTGKRFPWGDTISQTQANYYSSTSYSWDVSTTRGYDPTYATGSYSYTSPVGAFAANGYGLYDMAGNVWEWCWDWYGSYGSVAVTDPAGPASGAGAGAVRVGRGGGFSSDASYARSASRSCSRVPYYRTGGIGFRSARSSVP